MAGSMKSTFPRGKDPWSQVAPCHIYPRQITAVLPTGGTTWGCGGVWGRGGGGG